ncbi:related to beta transducin-like protein [Phialocephala subalpina]|uniref:Related to beta transducin-like protein n=1 Tax=Phialocephala subalpina TaxID=576137 RepID=A0A1L7X300_9HELO|nr:related to beta transducin-like protein [Phialocephala subalpina]
MRLLKTQTHELVFYPDDRIPQYAILSHTWGTPDEEVSFQDMQTAAAGFGLGTSSLDWRKKPGWTKIQRACAEALRHGFEYLWVDTCCIDKSSSAELQEGINSMFRWYEEASVCLAYLSDVPPGCDFSAQDSEFRKSRWFTRGWTLQELLAPETVHFFDSDWNEFGGKRALSTIIEEISGIEARYIVSGGYWGAYERLSEASVAQRMSWMSRRKTTRTEDMAYCLLGIFGIHMPMLYGEGDKAFKRLQEEIMKASDDITLLAWGYKSRLNEKPGADSILAPDPGYFKNCYDLVPSELVGFPRPSFSMAQRGLMIKIPVRLDQNHDHITYAVLACGHSQSMLAPGRCQKLLVIPLISVGACNSPGLWKEEGEYLRYHWCTPTLVSTDFVKEARMESIVILRPSRLTERPQVPQGILRPLRRSTLIGIYPLQPEIFFIGTRFISLSSSWLFQSRSKPQFPNNSNTSAVSSEDENEIQWREKRDMRMLLINTSEGNLLVVLEYGMEVSNEIGTLYITTCRAFEMPAGDFDLELLHNLAQAKTYVGLRELTAISGEEEDKVFRIKEEVDIFLFIRTHQPNHFLKPSKTEIEIFIERS